MSVPRLALVAYDFQLPRMRVLRPHLPPCEWREFDLRDDGFGAALAEYRPHAVVQYGSETTDEPRAELNRRYALAPALAPTFFAENAWLPQSAYLYLDPQGLAEQSAYAALTADELEEPADEDAYAAALAAYRERTGAGDGGRREDYVLLCLQIPDDTVVLRASPLHDMQALVDLAEARLHGARLVVRPHPLDPREYRTRRAALHRDGTAGDWIRRARAVIACNSTTLLEAVAWDTPAVALGRGIFSGKGVCEEHDGRLDRLRGDVAPRLDPDAARRFLWGLFRRQIPLDDALPDLTPWNPVLPALRGALPCAS